MRTLVVPAGTLASKFPPYSTSGQLIDNQAWVRHFGRDIKTDRAYTIQVPDNYIWNHEELRNQYGVVAP